MIEWYRRKKVEVIFALARFTMRNHSNPTLKYMALMVVKINAVRVARGTGAMEFMNEGESPDEHF